MYKTSVSSVGKGKKESRGGELYRTCYLSLPKSSTMPLTSCVTDQFHKARCFPTLNFKLIFTEVDETSVLLFVSQTDTS